MSPVQAAQVCSKWLKAQVPEGLGRVILKCLEKDREKRFAGAEELFLELSLIFGGWKRLTKNVMSG